MIFTPRITTVRWTELVSETQPSSLLKLVASLPEQRCSRSWISEWQEVTVVPNLIKSRLVLSYYQFCILKIQHWKCEWIKDQNNIILTSCAPIWHHIDVPYPILFSGSGLEDGVGPCEFVDFSVRRTETEAIKSSEAESSTAAPVQAEPEPSPTAGKAKKPNAAADKEAAPPQQTPGDKTSIV